jgi:hypothetical protein
MNVSGWSAAPTVIQRIPPYPTSLRTWKPRCRDRRPVRTGFLRMITGSPDTAIEIPVELDTCLVNGAHTRHQRLAQLSPAQRAALVLERYRELRALPKLRLATPERARVLQRG